MAITLATGTLVAIASTYGASVNMTAITNAAAAVATLTASHGAMISFGCSPRASINLALAAKAVAFMEGRAFVIPEDVRAVANDVMNHRLGLSYEAEAENLTAKDIVSKIIAKVAIP